MSYTGQLIGSGIVGKLMVYGRRRMMMIGACIGICGHLLLQTVSFPVWIVGHLIHGFGGSFVHVSIIRFLEESVPKEIFAPIMAMYLVGRTLAVLAGSFTTTILPPDDDIEALEAN